MVSHRGHQTTLLIFKRILAAIQAVYLRTRIQVVALHETRCLPSPILETSQNAMSGVVVRITEKAGAGEIEKRKLLSNQLSTRQTAGIGPVKDMQEQELSVKNSQNLWDRIFGKNLIVIRMMYHNRKEEQAKISEPFRAEAVPRLAD